MRRRARRRPPGADGDAGAGIGGARPAPTRPPGAPPRSRCGRAPVPGCGRPPRRSRRRASTIPSIPFNPVASDTVEAIGWCAPVTGPDRPPLTAEATLFRLVDGVASEVAVDRLEPAARDALGELWLPQGQAGGRRPLWAPGRYVIRLAAPSGGYERYLGIAGGAARADAANRRRRRSHRPEPSPARTPEPPSAAGSAPRALAADGLPRDLERRAAEHDRPDGGDPVAVRTRRQQPLRCRQDRPDPEDHAHDRRPPRAPRRRGPGRARPAGDPSRTAARPAPACRGRPGTRPAPGDR